MSESPVVHPEPGDRAARWLQRIPFSVWQEMGPALRSMMLVDLTALADAEVAAAVVAVRAEWLTKIEAKAVETPYVSAHMNSVRAEGFRQAAAIVRGES